MPVPTLQNITKDNLENNLFLHKLAYNKKDFKEVSKYIESNSPMSLEKFIDIVYKSSGGNINFKDKESRTALHYAVQSGNKAIVEFFLERGADPTAQDKNGNTPLDYAKHLKRIYEDAIETQQSKQESRTFRNSVSRRVESSGRFVRKCSKGGEFVGMYAGGGIVGTPLAVLGAVVGSVGGTVAGLVAPLNTTIFFDISGTTDANDHVTRAEGTSTGAIGGILFGGAFGFSGGVYAGRYVGKGLAAVSSAVVGGLATVVHVPIDAIKGLHDKTKISKYERKVEGLKKLISKMENEQSTPTAKVEEGRSETREGERKQSTSSATLTGVTLDAGACNQR